jgi:eukaryotic-like serine/threonine-protein kinase
MSEKLIGQMIDRYQVIEQLGAGGMAAVYRAFDTRLERSVALKVILQGYQSSPEFLKRFDREAKALAQLSHPNIVSVHDYGDYNGMPYLVMEYLPGGTFKEKFGRQMTSQEAARVLAPLARALGYAHQRGIIHRDVKPANVLITESGEPMLSDFGIAKILAGDQTQGLTGTGVGIGTPTYMAPEQGMGQKVDARADIYALGVMFYEMVTGRQPYRADTPMAIMLKKNTEPLPGPRQFAPHLTAVVEGVILKALAREPEHRYASMNVFGAALERIAAGEATPVQPAAQPKPAAPVEKRGLPFPMWALAGMGVLGVLAVVTVIVVLVGLGKQNDPDRQLPPATEAASLTTPSMEELLEPVTVDEDVPLPAEVSTLAPTSEPLHFSPITLDNITHVSQMAVWGKGKGVDVAYSINGSRLAVGSVVGVYVLDANTLMMDYFIDVSNPEGLTYLGDGARLAVWKDSQVNLHDAVDGSHIKTIDTKLLSITTLDFSADGSLMLVGTFSGDVQVWDIESGSLRQEYDPFANGVSQVALLPGCSTAGRACYVAAGNKRWHPFDEAETSLRIWDLDGTLLHSEEGNVYTLTFSQDGDYLAAGSKVFHTESWNIMRDLEFDSSTDSAEFSPDSTRLALGAKDALVYDLASGELVFTLDPWVVSLAYAPDGGRLATVSQGGDLQLWDAAEGELLAQVEGFGSGEAGLEIFPDGSLLAAGCSAETCFYQVEDGSLVGSVEDGGDLGLSADGSLLAVNESLWRVPDGVLFSKVDLRTNLGNDFSLSPDSSLLAVARRPSYHDVQVFDTITGEMIYSLEGYEEDVMSLAFSPDGALLALGVEEGGIEVRAVEDGALLFVIPIEEITVDVLMFSPDSTALAAGHDNCQVSLWSAADGAAQGLLGKAGSATGCVHDLSYSPDGMMLAAAVSWRIEFWGVEEGALLHKLTGHVGSVEAVRFSPQGDYIASTSEDGTIRLWGVSP